MTEYDDNQPLGLQPKQPNDREWIKEPGVYEATCVNIKSLPDTEQIQLVFHTLDGNQVYQEKFKTSRPELAKLISGLGLDPITVTPAQLKAKPMRLIIGLDEGGYKHTETLEWLHTKPETSEYPQTRREQREQDEVPF